jgi:hypothetical protein
LHKTGCLDLKKQVITTELFSVLKHRKTKQIFITLLFCFRRAMD